MTEEEAKTKACHLTLLRLEGPIYCLASACMAWRRIPDASSTPFARRIYSLMKSDDLALKIQAIKEWRQEFNVPLKEAKSEIDEIWAGRMPIPGLGTIAPKGYCSAVGMPR